MTLTFTIDALDQRQIALRDNAGRPDGMQAGDQTPAMGDAGQITLPGLLRRIAAALRSRLPGDRRGRPPQDRHLRCDIGLPEDEGLPHYWDFTRLDR